MVKTENKIGFELGPNMIDCPPCWQNFIQYLQADPNWYDVPLPVIQRELKAYGARYRLADNKKREIIEFDNEQSYMWFLLRWT